MKRKLKDWAQELKDSYDSLNDSYGCTCFLITPCMVCSHHGAGIESCADAWEEIPSFIFGDRKEIKEWNHRGEKSGKFSKEKRRDGHFS